MADLRAYHARKRPMAAFSLTFAGIASLLLWLWSTDAALSLLIGTACGLVNSFAVMFGYERLGDGGAKNTAAFAISSILRLIVFGIMPAVIAIRGPIWAVGFYYLGFFAPLAFYSAIVARAWRAG